VIVAEVAAGEEDNVAVAVAVADVLVPVLVPVPGKNSRQSEA
jgi:hypothetical protein